MTARGDEAGLVGEESSYYMATVFWKAVKLVFV